MNPLAARVKRRVLLRASLSGMTEQLDHMAGAGRHQRQDTRTPGHHKHQGVLVCERIQQAADGHDHAGAQTTAEKTKKSLCPGGTWAGRIQTPTWQKTGSPATSVIGQRSQTGSSGRLGAIETGTELETEEESCAGIFSLFHDAAETLLTFSLNFHCFFDSMLQKTCSGT